MDKKILLGGAAALIMGAGLYAAPASASAISVDWSGEATLSAVFADACNENPADLDANTAITGATDALSGCTDDLPVWATSSEYKWSAGGTLANGLGVSVGDAAADGVAITLSGAFGSVSFEDGGDSAVKAALPNSDGDIDVTGEKFGGHALSTSGTAGYVVNYQAPSVGGLDLYISYAPSSENAATNTDKYLDTIAFGAKMAAGDITIGAGYETASANANACAGQTLTVTGTPLAQSIAAFQGQNCGDQTLMGIGASMSVADLGLNVGYTALDTEGGDTTTYNIGLSTSMGAYSLALDYVNSTLDYASTHADAVDSTQTVLAAGVSTNLGDGVDLGLAFSNNSVNVLDQGAHSNYRAEAKLTITY